MIEGDQRKFVDLTQKTTSDRAILINAMVGFGEDDNLDTILRETEIPRNYDVLSIDIDGNDYHVWEVSVKYRPKIVVIEYNPTIPDNIDFIQRADARVNQGASLCALKRLAKKKKYELICVTDLNAIFVDESYFPMFGIGNNSIDS